ncbi:MAG: hypothetical protein K6G00_02105 [Treponema sp.]|nr:hypothetical protein [Treponema sp.]
MGFMKAVAAKLKKAADELKQEFSSVESKKVSEEKENAESTLEVKESVISENIDNNAEETVSDSSESGSDSENIPVYDKKAELINVLKSQDELLDSILTEQNKMHSNVKDRDWESLQNSISALRNMSDTFVELDQKREMIADSDRTIYYEPSVEPLFVSLRTKLTKSKIENEALRTYVTTTKDFIGNVIDECFVKTATTYSPTGKLVKPEVGNVLVNIEF